MRCEFALWQKTLEDGRVIMSGPLFGGMEITIWPAREKKSERSPTHTLVVSERKPKKGQEEVPGWSDL